MTVVTTETTPRTAVCPIWCDGSHPVTDEGIELDPADAEALVPLLVKANAILRTGRRA